MKRILAFGLLFMLSSVALFAAKNSYTFYLSNDVLAGTVQIPRGQCEMTWNEAPGKQVILTIKAQGKKTLTVPARMVDEKRDRPGMSTSTVDGVTHLQEIDTRNARFIIEGAANGAE